MLLFRSHGSLPQRLSLDLLHCILIVWIDYGVCGDLLRSGTAELIKLLERRAAPDS